jgi:hypothetical protein
VGIIERGMLYLYEEQKQRVVSFCWLNLLLIVCNYNYNFLINYVLGVRGEGRLNPRIVKVEREGGGEVIAKRLEYMCA